MCNSEKNAGAGWIVRGLLLVAVIVVFGQTLGHDFVNYDDNAYLLENQKNVAGGLTASSVAWAFTTNHSGMWGPVTWLSYLLDCQLVGLARPWGFHLTNVLLHAAATLLLFETFRRMTGRLWPSALVAALFAIHPLHVESVAWVAERKGLLSGLFFILTLLAYARYVRRPFSWANYLLMTAFFVLSLMAKPAAVTLPFLLLLLDYWPLGRGRATGDEGRGIVVSGQWPVASEKPNTVSNPQSPIPNPWSSVPSPSSSTRHIILEKLPLFALAIAACAVAPLTQGKAVVSVSAIPISTRIANALVAYVSYLEKFFWPENLAAIYLHSGKFPPMEKIVGAAVILLAVSTAAVIWRRQWPWLFVGWFWFLGTLVPMLGLVQLGSHSMADRYTYITQIGLYIAVAWSLAWLVAVRPRCLRPCAIVSAAAVIALMAAAWLQTSHWRDSKTLWTHVVSCYRENGLAYDYLGLAFLQDRQIDEAKSCYLRAFDLDRNDIEAESRLGYIFATEGQYVEAADYFRRASKLKPDHVGLMNNLALALVHCGEMDEAVEVFRRVLAADPQNAAARQNLDVAIGERDKKKQKLNADERK